MGTVSVIRDITLQNKSQQQLRELSRKLETEVAEKIVKLTQTNIDLKDTRERFFLIANATNECIWDWDIASNKIWGNYAYLKLLDKKEGELIDYLDFINRVHVEDNIEIARLFQEAIQKKEKQFTTTFSFNALDGTVRNFVNKSYIVYDENGNPKRCLGGLTDITEQNKIQQQIIKEKEISDNLINSLPGVFYMFNKEGKYLRWNKNILQESGYTEEDLKSMNPLDFVPVDQQDVLMEKIQSVFTHGADTVEAEFLTKDGKKIPYYFTGSYVKIDGEDCLMGVGYDMTEKLAYQQQLKDLASHLETIREEEQMRISREIHDELGQQLTGMKMQLNILKKAYEKGDDNIAEKIQETILLTDDTIRSVRKISIQLRPTILDDLGLVTAIECLTEDINNKYNIPCVFKTNYASIELDQQTATSLYRIFQESMTNIIRHAEATLIEVSLHSDGKNLFMSIRDNGKGFDTSKIQLGKTIGLIGIKERSEMIGASCKVLSDKGQGTEIIIQKKLKSVNNI
jgi:PAS domain S-box-containing protein